MNYEGSKKKLKFDSLFSNKDEIEKVCDGILGSEPYSNPQKFYALWEFRNMFLSKMVKNEDCDLVFKKSFSKVFDVFHKNLNSLIHKKSLEVFSDIDEGMRLIINKMRESKVFGGSSDFVVTADMGKSFCDFLYSGITDREKRIGDMRKLLEQFELDSVDRRIEKGSFAKRTDRIPAASAAAAEARVVNGKIYTIV